MEAFNEMMRNFISMQQKTFGFFYENTKTPIEYSKDFEKILENSVKFHKAALDYHQSIIQMLESMGSTIKIFEIKK